MGLFGSLGESLFGGGRSSSKWAESATRQPPWARKLGQSLSGSFEQLFDSPQALKTGLSEPMGIVGNIYQNIFGDDPTTDFVGARSALEQNIGSARGFGDAVATAYEQMLPTAQRAIKEVGRGITAGATPQGLRFSTDVLDLKRRAGQDIMEDILAQSAGIGQNIYKVQTQGALSVLDLIASMAEGQKALQVPLAIQLATGIPSETVSQSGGRAKSKESKGIFSSIPFPFL